jgi:flagellar protein FlaJ
MELTTKALLASAGISGLLIVVGIVSNDIGVLGNAIILSTFITAVPQLLMRYERYRALKEMEDRFPIFLRDIIESLRSGVPFHQAIMSSSKIDYGKLSKEVNKMANQISWGLPFDKVIDQFAERVKHSRRLSVALRTIRETQTSGGDIISSLESVAETSVKLEESDEERSTLLSQYTVLMYVVCFLFIGIVASINRLMVPIFQVPAGASSETLGLINPCETCSAASCSICDMFRGACSVFGVATAGIGCYYTALFFFMSIVEAICCGLVAGQISENSIMAGLKHSIIMSTATFGAFSILIRLGLMGL